MRVLSDYVTLYLNESGEKTWPEPWGRSSHRHYVLMGVILTPLQDKLAHEKIPTVLAEFFPNEESRPTELHYGDVINGRPPYGTWTGLRRLEIANRVFRLIGDLRPLLMGTVVRKDWMKLRYGSNASPPNEYALRATIDRFNRHLEETSRLGIAIMDTEGFSADSALRNLVHKARSVGIKLGGINFLPRYDRKLNHVLNSVSFSPSQMSPGIQMADFIAYATFSHFERQRSSRFRQIESLWRSVPGFREPSVLPKHA